ncbi:hypothetical protein KIW84_052930 [Lathyrus oleraceus]|uniref:Uncharacterized protein n=1 Tax=Pisum sativum TaxID=3888 RepID=A0A9D4WTJ7_PEA|nr:hypothetical protein KIW84_052930 [Pisum sativum]
MLEAVGSYDPYLKPPSFHELRVPLLQKELEYTKGYYLNSEYYYEKSEIENDPKLVRCLRKCIETLNESDEVEDKISVQLAQYKGVTAEWWKSYGAETPDLKLLAVKSVEFGLQCFRM